MRINIIVEAVEVGTTCGSLILPSKWDKQHKCDLQVLVLLGRHGGRTANTWCLVSSSTFSGLFSGKLEISNCNLPINMDQI